MTDLEQVRARVRATSEGEWHRHGSDVWSDDPSGPLFRGRDGSADVRRQADADAEFVAHAREDVLLLLRLLDERAGAGPDSSGPGREADSDSPTEVR